MNFLIIDDDKTFRDATCFIIEEDGHYAEGAESEQLGLTQLREDKFEAVLLDVNLGAENGLDVLVEIQKQHPDLPVVMFTAHARRGRARFHSHFRRKRHGQERRCAGHPSAQPPGRKAFHHGELSQSLEGAPGERTVRPREGFVHGAVKDHWGKIKAADGGTLFLDEIGDLPMEIQPKLLRLLQEREYERLGENITRQADVRVIAATNRNLKSRVTEGTFREDLYFRLNVIAVEMPPLRDRHEDLVRFASHYLEHFAAHCGRHLDGFSEEATACIRAHSWPGNLRELRNAIERAVILTRETRLVPKDLPAELQQSGASKEIASGCPAVGSMVSLEQLEEAHIRRVLEQTKSRAEAAEVLGIDQATLYRKRKKIGLE